MHGTIIHFDLLTGCGLLRPEKGHSMPFRQDQLTDARKVSAGQPVLYTGCGDALAISTRITSDPAPAEAKELTIRPDEIEKLLYWETNPRRSATIDFDLINRGRTANRSVAANDNPVPASPAPVPYPQQKRGVLLNWPGTVLAAVTFGLLLAAGHGDKPGNRFEKNVPLINSVWSVGAALLLVLITYWQATGVDRRRISVALWGAGLLSALAYLFQAQAGFVVDGAGQYYIYALLLLILVVHVLPYKARY